MSHVCALSAGVRWRLASESFFACGDAVKRTYQPNRRRRAKTHGFRHRMRTRAGRSIMSSRRRKGRTRLAA